MNKDKQRRHVLVVEDEEHLATGIKYNLVAEGFRVSHAADGPTALKILAEDPDGVDLMILDLMLPGMSGYAVCEAVRAKDRLLPILILSARTLPEDRTRGFDLGANQYLTKPFDLDEFLSRVNNLLTFQSREARQAARPGSGLAEYEFDGCMVNFETFEVTVRGEAVRMTQLEISLLKYFIEHEGRVIPRRELLENVWGMPGNLTTRAPDQFIRRLRKTFELDAANPKHFLTIRDAGYRFLSKEEDAVDAADDADAAEEA